jgi:uncharacterized protein involved in exopolysaccharide biosynthesis
MAQSIKEQNELSNIYDYVQEDEIDLRELFATIKKHIWKIISFSFVVTSMVLIYVIFLPNIYKSDMILVPQEQTKPSIGGLGALAGLAGIDLGGGGMDAMNSLSTIIADYEFNQKMITKYSLDKKLLTDVNISTFVYPFGLDLAKQKEKDEEQKSKEEIFFDTYKEIQNVISISSDKKSGAITISAEHPNRFLTKNLVDIYLKEATSHLRKVDLIDTQKQIDYYERELAKTTNIELREQLSKLVSGLIQKKVLSEASEYYIVKKITDSRVAFVKDKIKPKRALILVVAFVTSIILGIFGVFFMEFLRNNKDEENIEEVIKK